MKILMTGATGLIGSALCQRLKLADHTIIGLSRSPQRAGKLAVDELLKWDGQSLLAPEMLAGVDAVVHLAGEPVAAGRWTAARQQRIRDSRILGTRSLVEAMRTAAKQPTVLVCGSAVGIYGDRGDEELDEQSAPGTDFLAQVCQEWEAEARRAHVAGIRTVEVRTGVVLASDGGALKKMLPPFKLGIGGRLGNGRQWFPWIHLDDIVGLFAFALQHTTLNHPINGTAPGLVTNAEFTAQLGQVLHRPTLFPVPRFGLKLLLGDMAAVLLASQKALPKAALEAGYKFSYPNLTAALEHLLG
ncbi:MAG: TIGR01777 family protein [Acidobacteria bacterium]|nr:TIGR01777 family protein [Acidobacteriota bacterium]